MKIVRCFVSSPRILACTIACTIACMAACTNQVMALPEDSDQPIRGTYDNSLLLLDEGKQVFYGTPGSPAQITQGTLTISGQEITIVRVDGDIKTITVTGNLAHYEQQPARDQAIFSADGETITVDYDSQHVSAIGKVRFSQGNDQWSACQVDYYLESRQLSTPSCPDGSQAEVILAPRNGQ